jgi:N-ethylmaleimide reductase
MSSSSLFGPVQLGDLLLENRIFLPPLTRCRSTQPGDVANALMADYYAQRTQAGFLITEGTQIEPRGQGYAWTPGIYSPEQIAGWKCVTDAVHAKQRPIFAQLWHVGRVSHRALQPGHEAPIAPSAVAATGVNVFIPTGPGTGKLVPPDMPRALSIPEIHELVEMYAQAARNALSAGFDGVEIHAANGYLINQFISERANFRTDAYGGSLSNRLRFLREVVEAVSAVVTPDRMGVRFSPLFGTTTEERVYLGLLEDNPAETYTAGRARAGGCRHRLCLAGRGRLGQCAGNAGCLPRQRARHLRRPHPVRGPLRPAQGTACAGPWMGGHDRLWPEVHRQSGSACAAGT